MLREYLAPLVERRVIDVFFDQLMEGGKQWAVELPRQLSNSDVVVFLLSPDSLASQYVAQELEQAFLMHEAGKLRIVPVLLRPCDWGKSPLYRFAILPPNAIPLTDGRVLRTAIAKLQKGWNALPRRFSVSAML
jgi:hypothetical protein